MEDCIMRSLEDLWSGLYTGQSGLYSKIGCFKGFCMDGYSESYIYFKIVLVSEWKASCKKARAEVERIFRELLQ